MRLCLGTRGKEVRRLQQRLAELRFFSEPVDGVFGPETEAAVRAFQLENGLMPEGFVEEPVQALLHSSIARPHPEDIRGPEPIDTDEMQGQRRLFQKIIVAQDAAEAEKQYLEGFMVWGLRFLYGLHDMTRLTLGMLEDPSLNPDSKAEIALHREALLQIPDTAGQILMDWLAGERSTGQADEPVRRARVGAMVLESGGLFTRWWRLAALALLAPPEGHPERDLPGARQALLYNLERTRLLQDRNGQLLTIQGLIQHRVLNDAQTSKLIDRGKAILENGRDLGCDRDFLAAAFGYCLYQAYAARERKEKGDPINALFAAPEAGKKRIPKPIRRWIQRAETIYEEMTELVSAPRLEARNLIALAGLYGLYDSARAAALVKEALDKDVLPQETVRSIVPIEARLRAFLGDYERVIELLTPILAHLEETYLAAVQEDDVEQAGETYSLAVRNLAHAYAALERWEEAIYYMEHGKSLRLRYEAGLRQRPQAKRLRALQSQLDALARGAEIRAGKTTAPQWADWVGHDIRLDDRLWEEYRRLRKDISPELLEGPPLRELSKALEVDEAVVLLCAASKETILAFVCAGDEDRPSGKWLLEDLTTPKLLQLYVGKQGDGWLMELGGRLSPPHNPRPALKALLKALEVSVAAKLRDILKDRKIRRLTIISDGWLHLAPFWALPSFTGYEVIVCHSGAHFLAGRRYSPRSVKKVVAVADPTLDLPVSSAEVASLNVSLKRRRIKLKVLPNQSATKRTLEAALKTAHILHFSGHGKSRFGTPLRSNALLVSPDWDRLPVKSRQEFENLDRLVGAWDQPYKEMRVAQLQGLGRLVELTDPDAEGMQRFLEYAERGTLWGQYRHGRLIHLAEVWTTEDIMLGPAIQNCSLVFLSSCSSGFAGFNEQAEYGGLVAALQLAGVPTVVSSLWPVSEEVTALFVDLFYEILAERSGEVRIADIVGQASDQLRKMKGREAAARLSNLREAVPSPLGRFYLEKKIYDLGSRKTFPFRHPYDWAAFYASGIGRIVLE